MYAFIMVLELRKQSVRYERDAHRSRTITKFVNVSHPLLGHSFQGLHRAAKQRSDPRSRG